MTAGYRGLLISQFICIISLLKLDVEWIKSSLGCCDKVILSVWFVVVYKSLNVQPAQVIGCLLSSGETIEKKIILRPVKALTGSQRGC